MKNQKLILWDSETGLTIKNIVVKNMEYDYIINYSRKPFQEWGNREEATMKVRKTKNKMLFKIIFEDYSDITGQVITNTEYKKVRLPENYFERDFSDFTEQEFFYLTNYKLY